MNEENPQHQMDANMLVQGREYYVVKLDDNRQPYSLYDNRPLRFEEIRNGGELIFLAPNGQEVVVDLNMINHDDGPFAIYHDTAAEVVRVKRRMQGYDQMGGGANNGNEIQLNNQIPVGGGRRHRRHRKRHTRRHKSGRKHKKTRRH